MRSEKLEKTYIDSNIWFSYITQGKYDDTFYEVKKLIETILDTDNSIILISDLVVLEVLSVIRNKIVQREPFTKKVESNSQLQGRLRSIIQEHTNGFMMKITESIIAQKLKVVKEKTPLSEFLQKVQAIQNIISGEITDSNRCRACRRPRDSYNYSSANHYDIQHALIAKGAGSNHLATSDKGYKFVREYFKDNFDIWLIDKRGLFVI